MTIIEPFEVVGSVCDRADVPHRFARITVRVEPARSTEFVNVANVAGFEPAFVKAAFSGIRIISRKYSWLTFRFVITDAKVHTADSNEAAFHAAGEQVARVIFKQIYKSLTIKANDPKTTITAIDTEGNLVQAEVGIMETSLLQGEYDVVFGDAATPVRIRLLEDMVLLEER